MNKFVAGHEITMKMSITEEQYQMLKYLSDMVPTLYILDICAVGATKLDETLLENQPRKANLIKRLRDLDLPHNCFSYICALMEKVSDSRGLLPAEELKNQILADVTSLKTFFQAARFYETEDYLVNYLDELLGCSIEDKRAEYLHFINNLNNEFTLYNRTSPTDRFAKAKKIISDASALTISTQHPIVTIALACLYENQSAKKIMKFRANRHKFDAENALADILLISRFAKIKLELEHHGRNGAQYKRVALITDDDGLSKLFNSFKPKAVQHQDRVDGRESKLTMILDLATLLTEASGDEFDAVADLLQSH